MGIKIKMHNEKWRIEINEELEFENKETMEMELLQLIQLKDKYGKLENTIGGN